MARVLECKQFFQFEDGYGIEQNGDHIYDVWEHNIRALSLMDREWPLHELRLFTTLANLQQDSGAREKD